MIDTSANILCAQKKIAAPFRITGIGCIDIHHGEVYIGLFTTGKYNREIKQGRHWNMNPLWEPYNPEIGQNQNG